jgi:hypothetical protein
MHLKPGRTISIRMIPPWPVLCGLCGMIPYRLASSRSCFCYLDNNRGFCRYSHLGSDTYCPKCPGLSIEEENPRNAIADDGFITPQSEQDILWVSSLTLRKHAKQYRFLFHRAQVAIQVHTLPTGDHCGLSVFTPGTPPSNTPSRTSCKLGLTAVLPMDHKATATVL